MKRLLLLIAIVLTVTSRIHAQDERGLAQYFEGKSVIVKIDMPATQAGITIYPQRTPSIDLKTYSARIKQYGAALRQGDSVMVTKGKVQPKLIEFQL
ncbi:MAG: hypothetical protein ABI882_18495, partial [Acidobacteriota bacterium]